ncbi:MAG: glutamate racemase [Myxococcota bacterium]|nr:glutamate racemase [Myxococcota bacterium]
MSEQPIGVFDSGVGGLTVVAALRQHLPQEDILYLGDTARVPYGTKSADTVRQYALKCGQFLRSRGSKAIVVACNTASAVGINNLRSELGMPVLGVIEPGCKEALRYTRNQRIGVLGTPQTVRSAAYSTLIHQIEPQASVISHACPLLVPLAEENMVSHPATQLILDDYLTPMKSADIDTMVLGCTHYPLFQDLIESALGPGVHVVNSAEAVARSLMARLAVENLGTSKKAVGQVRVFLTDYHERVEAISHNFLKGNLPLFEHTDL